MTASSRIRARGGMGAPAVRRLLAAIITAQVAYSVLAAPAYALPPTHHPKPETPAVAAARLAGVRVPDKFEAQPVRFFEQVHSGYAQRMAGDPGRFARIDAATSREAVWAQVLAAIPAGRLA